MNLPCLIHGVSDGRCGHCADCGLHVTLETDAFDNPMLYHILDDDTGPATESVAHIIRHRLRDDGLVSVAVVAEVSHAELHGSEYPDDSGAEDYHPDGTRRPGVPEAGAPPRNAAS